VPSLQSGQDKNHLLDMTLVVSCGLRSNDASNGILCKIASTHSFILMFRRGSKPCVHLPWWRLW
jgi:hypothetical protein